MEGPCVLRMGHPGPVVISGDQACRLWEHSYHPSRLHLTFLHLLTQDSSQVREEMPLLVQVSCPGITNEGIYSNPSQISSVDVSEEDQPKCPDI